MENSAEQITQQIFSDETKNIFVKMFFKNGLPHGESITYKKGGEVIQKMNFVNGKMNGEFILFDKRKMKARLHYNEDILYGKAEYFDENEQVIGIENYKHGKKYGITEWKDSGGNLLLKENYKEGFLDGEKFEYSPPGKLKRKSDYQMGKIIGQPEEFGEKDANGESDKKEKKTFPIQINIVIDTIKKFLLSKLGFE